MNPTNNFGPQGSPATPEIPTLPQADGGSFGAPLAPGVTNGAGVPGTPPPAAAAWLPPTVPVAPQAGNGSGQGQSAPSGVNVSVPDIADDGDIIEKEWVDKAKEIVGRTRQDPYKQARELHRFKAEYLRKRYNKTIEAVED